MNVMVRITDQRAYIPVICVFLMKLVDSELPPSTQK